MPDNPPRRAARPIRKHEPNAARRRGAPHGAGKGRDMAEEGNQQGTGQDGAEPDYKALYEEAKV